ncbi:hypothetical protein, partial [Streptomyces rhizosphaericus]
ICPPWCAGHDGAGYQHWYDTDNATSRDHMADPRYVGEVGVSEGLLETAPGVVGVAFVEVYSDDASDLTPTQARELASLLLEAADRAEAQR